MPDLAGRLPSPPQGIKDPVVYNYLQTLALRLNGEAYVSKFSGTNPNVSAVTGIPGNLVVNIGSASDNSRLWVKSGSTVLSSTTGWKQLGLGGGTAGTWTTVIKSSDETRASSASLLPDSALQVALTSGSYNIRGLAWVFTDNATMDYQYDLDYTGTVTGVVFRITHAPTGAAAGTDNETTEAGTLLSGTSTSVTAATSGTGYVAFDVSITVSSSGSFQFRWAQNTSDAGVIHVFRGSYLEYASS